MRNERRITFRFNLDREPDRSVYAQIAEHWGFSTQKKFLLEAVNFYVKQHNVLQPPEPVKTDDIDEYLD